MRKLLIMFLLTLVVPAVLTSCRGHRGHNGSEGEQGEQGEPGPGGIDGVDGLTGIGFDYVRGMDGASVCNTALVVPAELVLPGSILNFAPAEDPYDPDGLTLTFGTESLAFRVYLGAMLAGEYCVVEKVQGEGWVGVGESLTFLEDSYVAIIPAETMLLFNTAFLATLIEAGVFLNFGPEEVVEETESGPVTTLVDVCKILDYSRWHLRIGADYRINFNRD